MPVQDQMLIQVPELNQFINHKLRLVSRIRQPPTSICKSMATLIQELNQPCALKSEQLIRRCRRGVSSASGLAVGAALLRYFSLRLARLRDPYMVEA